MELNTLLLYGGGALAGLSALTLLVVFLLFRLKKARLMAKLEKEYGER